MCLSKPLYLSFMFQILTERFEGVNACKFTQALTPEALADVGVQIRPALAHPFKQLELVHSRNSKARAGTNRVRSTLVLGLRPCSGENPLPIILSATPGL